MWLFLFIFDIIKVHELRKLLEAIPPDISKEEFDELQVCICQDGENYYDADIIYSGLTIITNFKNEQELLFSIQPPDMMVIIDAEQLN